MTPLDLEIEKTRKALLELQRKKKEEKLKASKTNHIRRRRGRPRIDDNKLIRVVQLAAKTSLSDAAFRVGVSRSTLHKQGITKRRLTKETTSEAI
jgi:hypothetical protein